jgi:hypothetical protein
VQQHKSLFQHSGMLSYSPRCNKNRYSAICSIMLQYTAIWSSMFQYAPICDSMFSYTLICGSMSKYALIRKLQYNPRRCNMPNYYPTRSILTQLAEVCYHIHSYAAAVFRLWNKCSDMYQYASVCL